MSRTSITSAGDIHKRIYTLPGVQVMLNDILAELFFADFRVLNNTFKWYIERFPSEFMLQLDDRYMEMNRSQFVTTSKTPLTSQNVSLKKKRSQHENIFPLYLLRMIFP